MNVPCVALLGGCTGDAFYCRLGKVKHLRNTDKEVRQEAALHLSVIPYIFESEK